MWPQSPTKSDESSTTNRDIELNKPDTTINTNSNVTGIKVRKHWEIKQRDFIQTNEQKGDPLELMTSLPSNVGPVGKRRVHFDDNTGTSSADEDQEMGDFGSRYSNEVSWTISHHTLGGAMSGQSAMEMDEPRSTIRDYIKGEVKSRPCIVRQRSSDGVALQHQEYRALPPMHGSKKGSSPSIPVKHTNTTLKRIEHLHDENQHRLERIEKDAEQYMTPLQRKELTIIEVNRQLQEAYSVLEQRENELEIFRFHRNSDIENCVAEPAEHVGSLAEKLAMLLTNQEELVATREATKSRLNQLKTDIEEIEKKQTERDKRHQEMYLEMYEKGRNSVNFVCSDNVVHQTQSLTPELISREETLKRLVTTQIELERWQMMKFSGQTVDEEAVKTEANSTFKFLKDAMFHYLTETKRESIDQHLGAMVGIFGYTDVHMKQIKKGLEDRKKRGHF